MTNELSNFATDAELVFNTQGQIWVLHHRKLNAIYFISEVNVGTFTEGFSKSSLVISDHKQHYQLELSVRRQGGV